MMLVLHSITFHLCTILMKCFPIVISTFALATALPGHSKQFGRYAMVSLCHASILLAILTSGDQFA